MPKSLEEAIHSTSKREVIIRGRGLYSKALHTKEYTKTNSSNKREEDPGEYISWLAKGDKETYAKGYKEPSDLE